MKANSLLIPLLFLVLICSCQDQLRPEATSYEEKEPIAETDLLENRVFIDQISLHSNSHFWNNQVLLDWDDNGSLKQILNRRFQRVENSRGRLGKGLDDTIQNPFLNLLPHTELISVHLLGDYPLPISFPSTCFGSYHESLVVLKLVMKTTDSVYPQNQNFALLGIRQGALEMNVSVVDTETYWEKRYPKRIKVSFRYAGVTAVNYIDLKYSLMYFMGEK